MTRGRGTTLRLLPAFAALAFALAAAGSSLGGDNDSPEVHTWSVDPDTDGVLLEDHRVPLVEVRIELPLGAWSAWARTHGASEAFRIQRFDPERRLLARSDELAVELWLGMGDRHAVLQASALSRDLDGLRGLIRDVLSNRELDRSQLIRWSRQAKLDWTASNKLPDFTLRRLAHQRCLDAADPRRVPWQRPRKPQRNVQRLLQTRDTLLRQPGRVIALAGAVDREQAERFAAGLLPEAGRAVEQRDDGLAAADCRPADGIERIALRGLTK